MQQFYISLISLGWMVLSHPYFISLTEIRQNPESQRLEIAQKIFWDDLEEALGDFHGEKVDFLNPENPEKLNAQIQAYLLHHNKIWLDGSPATLKYLGYELEEDAAWFYMESLPLPWKAKIRVQNSILIKNFSSQQNIIHVYKNSKSPKSLLLGKGMESGQIEF